jgi:hypothetical protein
LSRRYCYLPLSWKSWNWFECAVCGVRPPQHTQTGSNFSTIAADSSNGVTNTRCCRYSCMHSWWWVEVPPETCKTVSRRYILLDIYWNILTMHGPINVKPPNNTSKWQMGFNSASKGLILTAAWHLQKSCWHGRTTTIKKSLWLSVWP